MVSLHLLDEVRAAPAYQDVAMRLPPGAGVRLIAILGTVAGLVRMSPNPGQG